MTFKFFSDYDNSADLLKRFKANYEVADNVLKFTIGEDYDYAVVFNSTDDIINPSARLITVIQKPSWNKTHVPSEFLEGSDYLFVHDRELFEKTYDIHLGGQIIETPPYMFYHDTVDKTFYHYATSTKKEKKLSIIISNLHKEEGIYFNRLNFINELLASDLDIDIYGKRLSIEDKRFKGPLDYKFMGLLPYEYSIAIENSVEKNYISEKFIDCVLCETVPIYYGAPNISEVYDNRFIKLIDLNSPTLINDIKLIISEKALRSTVNKSIYFERFNLYNALRDIVVKEMDKSR